MFIKISFISIELCELCRFDCPLACSDYFVLIITLSSTIYPDTIKVDKFFTMWDSFQTRGVYPQHVDVGIQGFKYDHYFHNKWSNFARTGVAQFTENVKEECSCTYYQIQKYDWLKFVKKFSDLLENRWWLIGCTTQSSAMTPCD